MLRPRLVLILFCLVTAIATCQRSCWKVIFPQMSVCNSVQGRGPHVTITHDALDLTSQLPPSLDVGHGSPLSLSWHGDIHPNLAPPPTSDIRWPSVEISWNLFIGPHCILRCLVIRELFRRLFAVSPGTITWWPPKHVQLASGLKASYWNAFLYKITDHYQERCTYNLHFEQSHCKQCCSLNGDIWFYQLCIKSSGFLVSCRNYWNYQLEFVLNRKSQRFLHNL